MSHDIVADALNKIMNAKRASKTVVQLKHHSRLLISVLALAKLKGYIRHYAVEEGKLTVELGKLHACGAIKPRFVVSVSEIEMYVLRYLPAPSMGMLIVSTSQGLMAHSTAEEKNIGGGLLAYFY